MSGRRTTTDPAEALQNALEAVNRLQDQVLELQAQQRIDQDYLHCLTLVIDNPAALKEIWKIAVSELAADTALRLLPVADKVNPDQLALVKKAMNDRFLFWSDRVQQAVSLREDDGTE